MEESRRYNLPPIPKEVWEKYRYTFSEEQWQFLRSGVYPKVGNWSIEDGKINIEGSFICKWDLYQPDDINGFFGLRFGKVTGNFICDSSGLTTLEGCPIEVGGDFSACFNKLKSIKGLPKEIGGELRVHNNTSLVSFEYLNETHVKGMLLAFNCGLTSQTIHDLYKYIKEKKCIWEMALVNCWEDIIEKDRKILEKYLPENTELYRDLQDYGIIK